LGNARCSHCVFLLLGGYYFPKKIKEEKLALVSLVFLSLGFYEIIFTNDKENTSKHLVFPNEVEVCIALFIYGEW
jgi:hypothetical protein